MTLEVGGQFHTHAGIVAHDDLIGHSDGTTVHTSRGARLVAVRPTLAEYVLEMPRGAQVIYPKDLGPILVLADVFPGARILESGVGSGALTTRAAARDRTDRSRDRLRDPRRLRAARDRERARVPRRRRAALDVEVRDVYEGIEERDLDRIVLDLPEPWRVVKHALESLRPGRHPARVPAHDPPGRPAARGARQRAVRHGRDARGAAAHLARRRAVDPARSPHGRAHGLPHPRPPAGAET